MVQGDLREMHRGSGGREGNGRSGCHRNRDNKCRISGKKDTLVGLNDFLFGELFYPIRYFT